MPSIEMPTSCSPTPHLVMPRARRTKIARVLLDDALSELAPAPKKVCEGANPLEPSKDSDARSLSASSAVNAAWNRRSGSDSISQLASLESDSSVCVSPSLSSVDTPLANTLDESHGPELGEIPEPALNKKLTFIANELLLLELNKTRIRLQLADSLSYYHACRASALERRNIILEAHCGQLSHWTQKRLLRFRTKPH